jgi:hypothetical protein
MKLRHVHRLTFLEPGSRDRHQTSNRFELRAGQTLRDGLVGVVCL